MCEIAVLPHHKKMRTHLFNRYCSMFTRRPLLIKTGFGFVDLVNHSLFGSLANPKYVAIVGSGPAGFYTAQQILKGNSSIHVDIFEKLPVPFGLVRFGVAPDHPEVKNVINTFTQTARHDRCTFFGNTEVGKDISLEELKKAYSAVVLCYGASADRLFGLAGEDLPNVLSARSFVGWYNGLPEDKDLKVNLDCKTAVVLGQGNVAFDVARILLTPFSALKTTDISKSALEHLKKSKIKTVHVVGRRGPLQVAFTIKELREMINLPNTKTFISPAEVQGFDKIIQDLPRPRRRLTELMYKTATEPPEKLKKAWEKSEREFYLDFKLSPKEFLSDSGQLKGVRFVENSLEGNNIENTTAVPTSFEKDIECGLVLRSIGYKGLPLSSTLPFNNQKGIIENQASRVKDIVGLYCSGWIATGPVGVILGTMSNGFETGKIVLEDLESGKLSCGSPDMRQEIINRIKETAVLFDGWEKIDREEIRLGEELGKCREKITDVKHMLSIAKS